MTAADQQQEIVAWMLDVAHRDGMYHAKWQCYFCGNIKRVRFIRLEDQVGNLDLSDGQFCQCCGLNQVKFVEGKVPKCSRTNWYLRVLDWVCCFRRGET